MKPLAIKNNLWSGGRYLHLIIYYWQKLLSFFKKGSQTKNASKPGRRNLY
ncbi:MAG: hypothetical protein KI791_01675 [Cyclobacteriaceae bacterium]|nr:hypothetical protein [Cyclobacteriaceae bacterium SS2]